MDARFHADFRLQKPSDVIGRSGICWAGASFFAQHLSLSWLDMPNSLCGEMPAAGPRERSAKRVETRWRVVGPAERRKIARCIPSCTMRCGRVYT